MKTKSFIIVLIAGVCLLSLKSIAQSANNNTGAHKTTNPNAISATGLTGEQLNAQRAAAAQHHQASTAPVASANNKTITAVKPAASGLKGPGGPNGSPKLSQPQANAARPTLSANRPAPKPRVNTTTNNKTAANSAPAATALTHPTETAASQQRQEANARALEHKRQYAAKMEQNRQAAAKPVSGNPAGGKGGAAK